MIDRPLTTISSADIQRLVDDGVSEGRTFEFKRELPGPKDSDRKEFLADVSSFANATGGDLIYGIEEEAGRAIAANGLTVANIDAEVLRLDQMIRSGISPRIVGCQLRAVPGLSKGPAIVIRIQRSWHGPHIISYQQYFRFFSRNASGKFPMDATDVRDAVLNAGSVEERIRTFRADRLARIVAGDTPVSLDSAKIICVHAVPFEAFSGSNAVDLHVAAAQSALFQPWSAGGWTAPEFNIDGIYAHVPNRDEPTTHAYVQLLRSGIVEATDSTMMCSPSPHPDAMPSGAFPRELFGFVRRIADLYKMLDVSPPVAILVSILGAKGLPLAVSPRLRMSTHIRPIDRSVLMLPEVVLNDWPLEPSTALKPILDALWQSFGVPRCYDYDESGAWKPHA